MLKSNKVRKERNLYEKFFYYFSNENIKFYFKWWCFCWTCYEKKGTAHCKVDMKKHNFTGYVDGKEMSALLIFYTNNEIQKLWMLFLFLITNNLIKFP